MRNQHGMTEQANGFPLQEQWVYILEKSDTNLQISKQDKDVILEGTAAVFGQENNNHRIYEEQEYLPHLDYLQEKIKAGRLVGELDHPEKYDVSLKNISHVIQKLWYVKESRQLKIQLKLINNHPAGEMAKALLEAGVPLSISSRAAGVVRENKRVQIKKIFTYDLVADPGFNEAQLARINESVGYDMFDKKSVTNGLDDVTESLGYGNDKNLKIYNVDDPAFRRLVESEEKNNEQQMSKEYVTIQELDDYSKIIKKEIDEIREKIATPAAVATDEAAPALLATLESRLLKIENYVTYLAENLDRNISYSEYLAENLDKNISYSEYLAENLDKNISYSEYLAENLDRNISYSEYLAENLDRGIAYSEYLAENLDKNISYSEYLAENLDRGISYSEYLAENLDKNISYSEYLAENLDRGISYSEYIAEKLEKNIAYSEYIAENVNVTLIESAKTEAASAAPIVESVVTPDPEPVVKNYAGLSEKITELLDIAKKQKAESTIIESKHHFFRFLTEENRKKFDELEETKKQKVVAALSDNAYMSEADVLRKWDAALAVVESTDPKYITDMPNEYKALFESLSQQERNAIHAQAQLHKLDTPYQIKNFWTTRPAFQGKVVGLVKLNESENAVAAGPKPELTLGYQNEHVAELAEQIGRKFNKK